MDEFHYYGDRDRGWAWQVPLIELTDAQFLLMSATLGDMRRIRDDLTRRTGQPAAIVAGGERPVPLTYSYALTPIHETIEELLEADRAPIYVVHPTQALALERAQALMSLNVCTRAEKDAIADAIGDFRFTAGFGRTLTRLVRHGIGVHHAGMLPRYRRLVEQLTRAGLLKVVCGTDTLGVGINVPIRTVLITSLSKYDGRRTRLLRAREFHQIAGRAGRAGFDIDGTVVVQAPEHEIENQRLVAKAGDDPKKLRRIVRKKPPDGAPTWSRATFDRLVAAEPEPLRSRFDVTHAMLLNVAHRPGDAVGRPDAPADRQRRGARRARGPRRACRGHARVAAGRRRAGGARPAGRRRPDACASSTSCRSTSPSTSRCRRSPWRRSSCSTGSPRPTRSTCSRCSSPPSRTRGRCCSPSSSVPAVRPWPR